MARPITRIEDLTKEERENLMRRIYGEWTTEPPVQEGWYWVSVLYPNNKRHECIIYLDEKQTYYAPVDWDDERRKHINELGKDVYLLGPIPPPASPTRKADG
jgi:hypothetical protein